MKHATPEEQTAHDIVNDPLAACSETEMERLIVEAIRAEREACADLCMYNEYGIECAKAIRARSKPRTPEEMGQAFIEAWHEAEARGLKKA